MHRIWINTQLKRYPVLVGRRLLPQLDRYFDRRAATATGFVIYDAQVFALHGPAVQRSLHHAGLKFVELVIPTTEKLKSEATLRKTHDFLLGQGVSRSDMVIAVGGGVVTDLAGYAAATILRGIPWIAVPTTLLGMVDAAVGGKTGINHSRGKNLIGAFWQPEMVLCDTLFLQTLPRRHVFAGFGEIAKYAGLVGEPMVDFLDGHLAGGGGVEGPCFDAVVRQSIEYKADIVARDEREGGRRVLLNLGHTFAHALEQAAGYGRWLHGEALVYGLWSALNLSESHLQAAPSGFGRYREILRRLAEQIPRRRVDLDSALEAMELDKKRVGRVNRLVLLRRLGRPVVMNDVPRREIRRALAATLRELGPQGG